MSTVVVARCDDGTFVIGSDSLVSDEDGGPGGDCGPKLRHVVLRDAQPRYSLSVGVCGSMAAHSFLIGEAEWPAYVRDEDETLLSWVTCSVLPCLRGQLEDGREVTEFEAVIVTIDGVVVVDDMYTAWVSHKRVTAIGSGAPYALARLWRKESITATDIDDAIRCANGLDPATGGRLYVVTRDYR